MVIDRAAICDKRNWVVGTILAAQAKARGDKPFLQFENGPPQTCAAVDAVANLWFDRKALGVVSPLPPRQPPRYSGRDGGSDGSRIANCHS